MSESELVATTPQEPSAIPKEAKSRIQSVDILRGLAILGMALSGMLPWGTLPAWMYHAQVPPPEMKFNPDIPGITWVDLVFPFFLFALGAAIPLSLGRKVEQLPRSLKTAGSSDSSSSEDCSGAALFCSSSPISASISAPSA